jgi:hypothetical protein
MLQAAGRTWTQEWGQSQGTVLRNRFIWGSDEEKRKAVVLPGDPAGLLLHPQYWVLYSLQVLPKK